MYLVNFADFIRFGKFYEGAICSGNNFIFSSRRVPVTLDFIWRLVLAH